MAIGRTGRVLGVTALLAALGGLAGALGGVLIALGVVAVVDVRADVRTMTSVFGAAAIVGFGVGAILGPILTWTLLRRTPIWRAIGETAVAAGLGAALSLTFATGLVPMLASSVGAATLAALRLRFAARKTRAALPVSSGEEP